MQASQTTKRDKRDNVKDANKKIVNFIYKLLLMLILAIIYNSFAIYAYVNSIALYQILIDIIKSSHYF